MKVLTYEDFESKSGVGMAIKHQIKALELNNVTVTNNYKEKDIDIAHFNYVTPKSFFIARKLKKRKIKIVYHGHSTEEDFRNSFVFSNLVSKIFKFWLKTCYNQGDIILTPTPYSKKILESYKLKRPIYNISNGIELDFYKKDIKKGKEFRKKFNFKESDKIIISVGHYIERKGILDFVEVAKNFPNYKFVWFGYTPLSVVPKNVKDIIKNHPDNIYFPGFVKPELLKNAYSGANLFFFPTNEETEGIVVLEAFATKLKTIIRDIPVYDDWLEDKVNVYKGKNNKEFINLIEQIINNKAKDLTDEAYKIAKEKDLKNIGKELIKHYNNILKEKNL